MLAVRGLRVVEAANGREAIEHARRTGQRPSVIVLDLLMPVMDGAAFLAAQPDEPLLANVPVIILTAQLQRPAELPPTVHATFTKPLSLPDLLDAIRHACSDLPRTTTSVRVGTERVQHDVHADRLVEDTDPGRD